MGARNRYHLSFWCFFCPVLWHFLAQLGGNPCSEASCGVVTFSLVVKASQVVLGSWNPEFTICPFRARTWPFQAPKALRFKGKMANCEATNTIKQGKNAKRTNGTHFTRARRGGSWYSRGSRDNLPVGVPRPQPSGLGAPLCLC